MKSKFLVASLFFFMVTVGGFYLGQSSWNGAMFIADNDSIQSHRFPAAVHHGLDFTKLDGTDLITSSKDRLVTSARVLLQDDVVGIELGHFVARREDGGRKLACDFYDRMALHFEADGVAEEGEKPLMEVEAPCHTATDITHIEAVWIPVAKILGVQPNNMDLSYPDQAGVNFHFSHMGSDWPRRWVLQSVRLYHQSLHDRHVEISSEQMHEIMPEPLVLSWRMRQPANQKSK